MPTTPSLSCMALALALLLPGLPHADEAPPRPFEDVELFQAEGVAGMLVMPVGAPGQQTPVVVVLPDALGADGRAAIYAEQILGGGFAVLEIATLDGEDGLALAIRSLALHPRIQAQPVGLLGFGAGARIAASWPGPVAARVLLYPGCADLNAAEIHGQAVLLLHGAADAANAAPDCTRLVETISSRGADARARAFPGAGYAWDYRVAAGEGAALLPRPNGTGRVAAAPWPALTEHAAAEVAAFFAVNFFGPWR